MLDGNVQSLGACVQSGILQAHITNGWGIDEGHQITNVIHEKAIKEINVLTLKTGQVQVLVDICLSCLDHLHGTEALGLQTLHGMGQETSKVLRDSLLGGERETC